MYSISVLGSQGCPATLGLGGRGLRPLALSNCPVASSTGGRGCRQSLLRLCRLLLLSLPQSLRETSFGSRWRESQLKHGSRFVLVSLLTLGLVEALPQVATSGHGGSPGVLPLEPSLSAGEGAGGLWSHGGADSSAGWEGTAGRAEVSSGLAGGS